MNIAKSIAVQDFIHFILIFWIPRVGVRIPCTTSSLEEVMPPWQRQRHQGPFLHLGHHALNILVRILREFWWWWLVLQVIIIKIHAVFTRSHPKGEISLSAYGEVLPHWTRDWNTSPSIGWRCISIACPLGQCARKMRMAGHGRSLRPPTPCLAKTDPKNIATAEDESDKIFLTTISQ